MTVTEFLAERLLPLLLPTLCLACDRPVAGGRHFVGLCPRCRGRLRLIRGQRCGGCGRPLRAARLPADYRCGACRRRPPAFDRLIAHWVFEPPLDAVIHGLKFQRLDYLGRPVAHELAGRLRAESASAGPPAELVVWVPLHWRRFLRRGYNQAERIARPLAEELGIPARRALARTRATAAQTGLERERRAANVARAWRARRSVRVRGRRVLLVDDVVTTGSTLDAASAALRAAGAAAITAVAAARTPGTSEENPCRAGIC